MAIINITDTLRFAQPFSMTNSQHKKFLSEQTRQYKDDRSITIKPVAHNRFCEWQKTFTVAGIVYRHALVGPPYSPIVVESNNYSSDTRQILEAISSYLWTEVL